MKYTQEIVDEIMVLRLSGDLIGQDNGPELMDKLNDAINEGCKRCVIDITDVRYINSSGLGVLITVLTKFRNINGEIVLLKPSESVQKLLIVTKLNSIFTIKEEEKEAVEFLKNIQ
ncbi:STAS domain-containing protein [Aureibacter tunicatorum]|uniref:Anti-sigma factor antagonist n=1 Tax=Aureibacter tunicatorum TaxID=866807 RepID=A0AAE4BSF3_9BACT|nr:STAS domain-containing protein [Aureibacter tunicatorum]MDR6238332.1 anti-sigma B factor antagonist [Aureibacter tunicatorum]BDD03364.1 anti-sigma factor antagonist [Aureibacter tunicatorum]